MQESTITKNERTEKRRKSNGGSRARTGVGQMIDTKERIALLAPFGGVAPTNPVPPFLARFLVGIPVTPASAVHKPALRYVRPACCAPVPPTTEPESETVPTVEVLAPMVLSLNPAWLDAFRTAHSSNKLKLELLIKRGTPPPFLATFTQEAQAA